MTLRPNSLAIQVSWILIEGMALATKVIFSGNLTWSSRLQPTSPEDLQSGYRPIWPSIVPTVKVSSVEPYQRKVWSTAATAVAASASSAAATSCQSLSTDTLSRRVSASDVVRVSSDRQKTRWCKRHWFGSLTTSETSNELQISKI